MIDMVFDREATLSRLSFSAPKTKTNFSVGLNCRSHSLPRIPRHSRRVQQITRTERQGKASRPVHRSAAAPSSPAATRGRVCGLVAGDSLYTASSGYTQLAGGGNEQNGVSARNAPQIGKRCFPYAFKQCRPRSNFQQRVSTDATGLTYGSSVLMTPHSTRQPSTGAAEGPDHPASTCSTGTCGNRADAVTFTGWCVGDPAAMDHDTKIPGEVPAPE